MDYVVGQYGATAMGGLPLPNEKERQKIVQNRKRIANTRTSRVRSVHGQQSQEAVTDASSSSQSKTASLATMDILTAKVVRRAEGVLVVESECNGTTYMGVLMAENSADGTPGIVREQMELLRERVNAFVDVPIIDQWTSAVNERHLTSGIQLRNQAYMRRSGRLICASCMQVVPDNELIIRRHFIDVKQRKMMSATKETGTQRIVAQLPASERAMVDEVGYESVDEHSSSETANYSSDASSSSVLLQKKNKRKAYVPRGACSVLVPAGVDLFEPEYDPLPGPSSGTTTGLCSVGPSHKFAKKFRRGRGRLRFTGIGRGRRVSSSLAKNTTLEKRTFSEMAGNAQLTKNRRGTKNYRKNSDETPNDEITGSVLQMLPVEPEKETEIETETAANPESTMEVRVVGPETDVDRAVIAAVEPPIILEPAFDDAMTQETIDVIPVIETVSVEPSGDIQPVISAMIETADNVGSAVEVVMVEPASSVDSEIEIVAVKPPSGVQAAKETMTGPKINIEPPVEIAVESASNIISAMDVADETSTNVRSAVDVAADRVTNVDSTMDVVDESEMDVVIERAMDVAAERVISVESEMDVIIERATDVAAERVTSVESEMDVAIEPALDVAVKPAVGVMVEPAMDLAIESEMDMAVESAVNVEVGSEVYVAVKSAIDGAVESARDLTIESAVDMARGSTMDVTAKSVNRVILATDVAVESAVFSKSVTDLELEPTTSSKSSVDVKAVQNIIRSRRPIRKFKSDKIRRAFLSEYAIKKADSDSLHMTFVRQSCDNRSHQSTIASKFGVNSGEATSGKHDVVQTSHLAVSPSSVKYEASPFDICSKKPSVEDSVNSTKPDLSSNLHRPPYRCLSHPEQPKSLSVISSSLQSEPKISSASAMVVDTVEKSFSSDKADSAVVGSSGSSHPPIKIVLKSVRKEIGVQYPSPSRIRDTLTQSAERRVVSDFHSSPDREKMAKKRYSVRIPQRRSDTGCPPMMKATSTKIVEVFPPGNGSGSKILKKSAQTFLRSSSKKGGHVQKSKQDAKKWKAKAGFKRNDNNVSAASMALTESDFKVGDIVWAKHGTDPYWPGKIHKFVKQDNKNGASIVWFGVDTYTPFIDLSRIESFAGSYCQRYNPRRPDVKYQKAVGYAIVAGSPKKGYFETRMSQQVFKIVSQVQALEVGEVNVVAKRKKRAALRNLSLKRRQDGGLKRKCTHLKASAGENFEMIESGCCGNESSANPVCADHEATVPSSSNTVHRAYAMPDSDSSSDVITRMNTPLNRGTILKSAKS